MGHNHTATCAQSKPVAQTLGLRFCEVSLASLREVRVGPATPHDGGQLATGQELERVLDRPDEEFLRLVGGSHVSSFPLR